MCRCRRVQRSAQRRSTVAPMSDHPFDSPEAGNVLYEQILALWVEPEIRRRGVPSFEPTDVQRVLVLLTADNDVEVLLDEEAEISAEFVSKRSIVEGEAVMAEDVESIRSLRPHSADPNAGWVLFVTIGTDRYYAFDFRKNLGEANRLLNLADEYLVVGQMAQRRGSWEPAIANAYVAAELAVKAQMLVVGFVKSADQVGVASQHQKRRTWLAQWVDLGNAPELHESTLSRLAELQKSARYGDREEALDSSEPQRLLDETAALVAHAKSVAGEGWVERKALS